MDDKRSMADAISEWLIDKELRENLHQQPSVLPTDLIKSLKSEPLELSGGIGRLGEVPVVVNQWLPVDFVRVCPRSSPINRSGQDEIWASPAMWDEIKNYIDAWAGVQEVGEV